MNRRNLFTAVGVALMGGWLAQAQPTPRPNLTVQASASTPQNKTPYTISLDITVENRGQADSPDSTLQVVLKPQGSSSNRPKSDVPTMFDPVTLSERVPALKPGEKKVFNLQTPYSANSAFRNRTGSFKANNVDPTGGDTTISVTTSVR